ncbi:hypothetical protein AVI51_00860 [Piscirickettsia salmonis]|uniref:Uncharacterized protein n=2 Tax=Piscirickettsia salmonis TaxID=1238 RepID=A0A9Q6LU17_PISSA|nr:hypothetical protein [Piscirickettsia salmonis]ALA24600.1 Nucleotide-diphospho-sugar transferases [Piscirickettsia salmonis]APS44949.1 hypothetical protein AVI48_11585 [Piscirickettsia salmonis]APS48310.1 hypothetical protein AVI49_12195 [Piscirickettsia salmonis]APS52753.1 hypothetical protein AVI51_00860 [Piscirickettsia salmonis]QGN95488.1 hypothetical protein Psal006a_02106 [Piscirickettsia salmonis]
MKYFIKAPEYYQSIFSSLWIDGDLYLVVTDNGIQDILCQVNELIKLKEYRLAYENIESKLSIIINNKLTDFEKSVYYYYYSICLFLVDSYDKAYQAIREAIKFHSEISYYYHNAAILTFKIEKYDEVILLLEKSRSSAIPFYLSSAYLAVIYSFEKLWSKSMICAQEAKQHHIESKKLVELCLITSSFKHCNKVQGDLDFNSFYHSDVDIENLYRKFPVVNFDNNISDSNNSICIFFACDAVYFLTYCIYSIFSINDQKVSTNVHVHLFNVDSKADDRISELINIIKKLSYIRCSYSFERVNYSDYQIDCPLYTSSMRFCRAYQYMMAYKRPVLIVDCDSLFKSPLDTIICDIHTFIAVLGDEYAPEWEKLAAGVVYLEHNLVAENYLKQVSYFIMNNILLGQGIWFLDQLALKFAYEITLKDKKSNYQRLDSALFCDLAYTDSSYIWMVTTKKEEQVLFNRFKDSLKKKYFNTLDV